MQKTLVMLLGGKSSRMGKDKCGIVFNGRPIFEQILDEVGPWFDEIILSANELGKFETYGLSTVVDEKTGCGPAGGILSVMNAFPRDYYQIVPCDTPFMTGKILSRIYDLAQSKDVGLVRTPDGPQPLLSTYSFSSRSSFERGINSGRFRILECIKDLDVREITIDDLGIADNWEKYFFNINSPSDLEKAAGFEH